VAEWEAAGADVCRTDLHGTVSVTFEPPEERVPRVWTVR
jgi:beta-lactamase superfamily II metal-dependent hydrolase